MTRGERRRRIVAWRLIHIAAVAILASATATAGMVWGVYSSMSQVLPTQQQIGTIQSSQGTLIYSSDGVLLAKVARENREILTLSKIPTHLINATIAIEDERFFHHHGVDPQGIARAVMANLSQGYGAQGGSTLTQQLARNLYLTRKKTVARKLQEALLALQIERNYTKEEILELYLNQVYYGHGAYGVQVASEVYFGKPATNLTLAEAALLAGLPRRPLDYSPFEHPDRAKARRNLVLDKMARLGYISYEEAEQAKQEPLRLAPRPKPLGLKDYHAPYFTSWLLRQLVRRYGADWVYKGGLEIRSTLNWQMQQAAERILREEIRRHRGRGVSEGALVAIDPHTGGIKAMVGGLDYSKSEFNCATQARRHPGSAFKIFVYTAAIENGYTPDTIVVDSPVRYPMGDGRWWVPKNATGGYAGRVTVRTAVARSINIPAVKVAADIGIDNVISVAHRMGISQEMPRYLSVALGSVETSPLEMALAASVLATGGLRVEPTGIQRMVDRYGNVIEENVVRPKRVISEDVARTMTDILSTVIRSGTGSVVKRYLREPAAGKTGTTNDYRDAWFVGYTRYLACAVWVGNRDYRPMHRIFGATIPAPIWGRFMAVANPIMERWRVPSEAPARSASSRPAAEAPRPAAQAPQSPEQPEPQEPETRTITRVLCVASGLLARPECRETYEQVYVIGQDPEPPADYCDIHGPERQRAPADVVVLPVCAETGKLATEFCPRIVTRTFDPSRAPTESCRRHSR